MPGLTEEEMAAIALESPWQIGGDEMLGKMIMQVFGARKLVESKILGWQKLQGSALVIYRCVQKCDGEFCDLPREEVIECNKKWEATKELKSLKNEITLAIEKIPVAIDVDNENALKNWLIEEVAPLVEIKHSIEDLIEKNPEVRKCVELCKKQARINQRMKREANALDEEKSRKKSMLGCL